MYQVQYLGGCTIKLPQALHGRQQTDLVNQDEYIAIQYADGGLLGPACALTTKEAVKELMIL
jgi:hypothetical protein